MRTLLIALSLSLPLALPGTADAATLAGVTLADSAQVGGQQLVLNGIGLREKYMLDVYVAGLYLPAKTTSASSAINDDVPKRLIMELTMSLSQEKLSESIQEAIANQGLTGEARAGIQQIAAWMEAVDEGDTVVLDYVPGAGTTMTIKGTTKGTVPGIATMKALWTIYLGDPPVTQALKNGLLGN